MDLSGLKDLALWIGNVLTEIITGIKETYKYWRAKIDEVDTAI